MSRQTGRKPRFDAVELLCVGVLLLAAGFGAGRWFVLNRHASFVSPRDLDDLRGRYGPHKWSENAEEWMIRDFFRDAQNGTFVDVGSADARTGSNTYFLESTLGWTGIAVDALAEYGDSYARYRPKTKFFAMFVGPRTDDRAIVYVSRRFEQYSSSTPDFTKNHAADAVARDVPTITLNDLLEKGGISKVDFLSMDIELSEPDALAGFDVRRFAPRLICIEAHPQTIQFILDYFADRGYTVVGKYLRVDQLNLWFVPR